MAHTTCKKAWWMRSHKITWKSKRDSYYSKNLISKSTPHTWTHFCHCTIYAIILSNPTSGLFYQTEQMSSTDHDTTLYKLSSPIHDTKWKSVWSVIILFLIRTKVRFQRKTMPNLLNWEINTKLGLWLSKKHRKVKEKSKTCDKELWPVHLVNLPPTGLKVMANTSPPNSSFFISLTNTPVSAVKHWMRPFSLSATQISRLSGRNTRLCGIRNGTRLLPSDEPSVRKIWRNK